MSEQGITTVGNSSIPDVVGAAVQEVLTQARNLGITWSLRIATVDADGPLVVIFDGDSSQLSAVSMIGALTIGQRVYVMIVPPSGNFVVGIADQAVDFGRLGAARFITYAQAVGSTTSATPVIMAGPPSLTITKAYGAQTVIEFTFAATFYGNGGGECGVAFWARDTVNGNFVQVAGLITPNGTNVVRQQCAGAGVDLNASNLRAGRYTYEVYWARITGGGLVQVDSNDMLSLLAKEVPVPL
jgi:hypothetical protein